MFDHIIAGFDGHDGGRDALALAAALRPRRLTVLMAYGPETIVAPTMSMEYWAELKADAERRLAGACADLGVGAETVAVAESSPARALHQAAIEGAADLLVVGSAHHGRTGRLLLGDVGSAVMHDAPCPVAVAPKHLRDTAWVPARVGIAFDGSDESRHALETAAAIARGADARVLVFTAWTTPIRATAPYPADLERIGDEEAERRAQEVLDRGVSAAGPPAEGRLLHGSAARALRDATADVDLMVVGSRGWGPARRVLLGSTSHRLVHDSACPVLVVPRPAAKEKAPEPARGAVTAAPVL